MNLKTLENLLLSQYRDSSERRFVSAVLERSDDEVSDVLAQFTLNPSQASGAFLDRIGELVDLERPPVPNENVVRFGFAPEDRDFGEGALTESDITLGPTLPMQDADYRRMLLARLQTLSATGLEDVQASAVHLFDEHWVYENTSREFAGTLHLNSMTADADNGVILTLTAGVGQPLTRFHIDPRTAEIVQLDGQLVIAGNPAITGFTWRGSDDAWLMTNLGAMWKIATWTDTSATIETPGFDGVFAKPPGFTGTAIFPTGFGEFEGSLYAMSNAPPFPIYELDLSGDTPTSTIAGLVPDGAGSLMDTPAGLLFGNRNGIHRLLDLPSDPAGDVTFETVIPHSGGTIRAAAYYGGRLLWNEFGSTDLHSDALAGSRGFSVFGRHADPFYLNAVSENRDKLFLRPAGVPMALYTEEIESDAT